jgi:hypothetical protein
MVAWFISMPLFAVAVAIYFGLSGDWALLFFVAVAAVGLGAQTLVCLPRAWRAYRR